MIKLVTLAAISALSGSYYFNVPVKITDNAAIERFDLQLVNNTRHKLCLSTSNWPEQIGKLESSADRVWVTVNNSRYFYTTVQDVCPSCRLKVKAGEKISSKLNYADFAIPKSLYNQQKELHFSVTALKCGY